MTARTSVGQRVRELAHAAPDQDAVISISTSRREHVVTRAELHAATDAIAWQLLAEGCRPGDLVGVALPNTIEHVLCTIGAWKLGATVVALPHGRLLTTGRYDLSPFRSVVTDDRVGALCRRSGVSRDFEAIAPEPRSASFTGGTTQAPRLTMRRMPWAFSPPSPTPFEESIGWHTGQRQLVVLPMYHGGFSAAYYGAFLGHTIIILERFSTDLFATTVMRLRPHIIRLVPALMKWISDTGVDLSEAFSELHAIHHGSAPIEDRVREWWYQMARPERVFEFYGAQEQIGITCLRGDQWMMRQGSVGQAADGCDLQIRDPATGETLPPGEIGAVYMKSQHASEGSPSFRTAGDLGWVDEDGYLYLRGRRSDIINVGGVSIHPLDVEEVLRRHPGVEAVAVFGVEDGQLGQHVAAAVVPTADGLALTSAVLRSYCRTRMPIEQVPVEVYFDESLPLTPLGKVDRDALRARREKNIGAR